MSVGFSCYYPSRAPPKSDLLRTEEKEQELMYAASSLLSENCVLRKVNMHFLKGVVILKVQSADNPEHFGFSAIDAVTTRFFQEQEEYIKRINPAFAANLDNLLSRKNIEKITDIFYFALNNYLEDYPDNDWVTDSVVNEIRLGFKNSKYCHSEIMDIEKFRDDSGFKFKKFLQSLPTSLLDNKKYKKAIPFLEKALEQKPSLQDKVLYLRQVIGFLLLQDIFKKFLEDMQLRIAISKQYIHSSPNREISSIISSRYTYRSSQINKTLSKFPINSILTLIPLACRSHPNKLSDFDLLNKKNPRPQYPFIIEPQYIARECNNAREANIALREVLEDSFKVPLQKSFQKDDCCGQRNLERFLMGISSLAISPGLYGRLPMYNHRTIYCKRQKGIFHANDVSDNISCEFLMTAAQFLFEKEYNWIESSCLAYVQQMIGNLSMYGLVTIKVQFQKIRDVVEKLPVETLLKPRSTSNDQYVLRNSGMKRLHVLYQQGREMSGLQPIPNNDSSSCSIL